MTAPALKKKTYRKKGVEIFNCIRIPLPCKVAAEQIYSELRSI